MKKAGLLVLLVMVFQLSHAQTWKEWFKQRKTQIQYLVHQIGALQTYIGFAKEGYKIVDQGLTTIGNVKNGDFSLHRDFFSALKSINPKIRRSAKVVDIVALQVKIIQIQGSYTQRAKASIELSDMEKNYIARVYARLLQQTMDNVEELLTLLTANQYELSDDARIRRIDLLQANTQEQYGFVRWFGDQTEVLVVGRRKEIQDGKIGQSLILNKK